jgi:N utilization substance protein B
VGNRHRGRELAFHILFQTEQGGHDDARDVTVRYLPTVNANPQAKEFGRDLAVAAYQVMPELDRVLQAAASNWDLKRFDSVDRAILRLGAFELLFRDDIPAEVTFDEWVEMAKEYGGNDSPKFVNGVLDAVAKANPRVKQEPGPKPRREDDPAAGGPTDVTDEED